MKGHTAEASFTFENAMLLHIENGCSYIQLKETFGVPSAQGSQVLYD